MNTILNNKINDDFLFCFIFGSYGKIIIIVKDTTKYIKTLF